MLDEIVAKTDGVPLFVEELTRMLLESGLLLDAGDRYELAGPLPPLAIPTSLQDSLMARLDRLGAVKVVAQVAAAIGREFVREIIACASAAGETLEAAISELLDAGLLVQGASQQRTVYAFKHVLVRDAAYSSLLRGARRSLHRRIATCLETTPGRENASPEVLANHWALGEVSDKAAVYFAEAARNAKANYANKEAVVFFRAALEQLERGGATAVRRDVHPPEIADLYEEMGDVLALVRAQVEATAAFAEALQRIPRSDRIRRARLHRKIGLVRQHERDLALKAFDDAEQALGAWPEQADDARSEWVDVQIGRLFVHYWKGEADAMNQLLARLEPHIAGPRRTSGPNTSITWCCGTCASCATTSPRRPSRMPATMCRRRARRAIWRPWHRPSSSWPSCCFTCPARRGVADHAGGSRDRAPQWSSRDRAALHDLSRHHLPSTA